MKKLVRLIALVLVLAALLTGCRLPDWEAVMNDIYASAMMGTATAFDDMAYVRPDMDAFRNQLDVCMKKTEDAADADALLEQIYLLYERYYDFYTQYGLANIRYCTDMTDIYWEQEYNWCMERSTEVDAGMDRLLYALAGCPVKEELEKNEFFGDGFFDDYQGQSLWDDTFTALMDQENALLSQYYTLSAQAAAEDYYTEAFYTGCGLELEEVFLKMVRVRQQIAEYAGYESYPAFAYEFYYHRDYTPEQAQGYMADIRQELVPLYEKLDSDVWKAMYGVCLEAETFDYTEECALAMGGVAADAFALMQSNGLYNISYSSNKYDASFETYLYNYYMPYIFVKPYGMELDKLTFTHEFGHFCGDYASQGSVAGIDVAEVFSQGLEYLSLEYCSEGQKLRQAQMASSLSTFVEQSAYATFEHRVYSLEESALTLDNVRTAYQQSMGGFGVEVHGQDYVMVPHFYIAPMYVISYVFSNDAAMQIYQAELAETHGGKKLWEDNLDTMQTGFLAFVEEAGLQSPFEKGRVQQLRRIFEEALG